MAGIKISNNVGFNPTPQFLPKFNGTNFVDSLLNEYDGGIQLESGSALFQVDDNKLNYADGINVLELNLPDGEATIQALTNINLNAATIKLNGDISITAAPVTTHGAAANRWLEISVGGSDYKIALLNP